MISFGLLVLFEHSECFKNTVITMKILVTIIMYNFHTFSSLDQGVHHLSPNHLNALAGTAYCWIEMDGYPMSSLSLMNILRYSVRVYYYY